MSPTLSNPTPCSWARVPFWSLHAATGNDGGSEGRGGRGRRGRGVRGGHTGKRGSGHGRGDQTVRNLLTGAPGVLRAGEDDCLTAGGRESHAQAGLAADSLLAHQ